MKTIFAWTFLLVLLLAQFAWSQTLTDPHSTINRDRPALSPHQKPDHQFSIKAPKDLRMVPVIQPKIKGQKPAEKPTTEQSGS